MRSDKLIQQLCAILHRNFTISGHNIVNTFRASRKTAVASVQNKIYFALKLRESASFKGAAAFEQAKNIDVFFVFYHQLFWWASVTSNNSGVIASA